MDMVSVEKLTLKRYFIMKIYKNMLIAMGIVFFCSCSDNIMDAYISTIEGGGQTDEEEAPVEVLTTYE